MLPDLPEPARVAAVRAAREVPRVRALLERRGRAGNRIAKGDVRGVALKVVGVEGKKVIPGMESAVTQDFLLIRTPVTPFRNADEFVPVLVGAVSPPFGIIRAGLAVEASAACSTSCARRWAEFSVPTVSVATTRYFSAAAIRCGAHAVHYALTPHARADAGAKAGASADYLADELAARLREGPVVYDFQVQFFVDETRTPIEDASVEWKEADAPFVTVARLTLPKQDVASESGRRVAEQIDGFSFDPWHAVEELRPLGNIMRARNVAYRVSTGERKATAEPES